MNTIQKIFVMVAVGSLVLIPVTIFGLGFEFNEHFFFSEKWTKPPWSKVSFGMMAKVKEMHPNWERTLLYSRTNWFGIIAVFNIVVSSVGFFLFKDK